MTKFTSELVDELADKLLIGLTPEENQMVLDEFGIIDATADSVNDIKDIAKVPPMTHCLDDFTYTLREDIVEESIPVEELLANCDETEGSEITVPKIVG